MSLQRTPGVESSGGRSKGRTASRRSKAPDERPFLSQQTTPTKSGKKKTASPLSQLRNDAWNIVESPHQGKSSQAFLLDRDSLSGEAEELFVKKVLIMSPDNANDKAYREQRILAELKSVGELGLCFNFVTMVLSGVSGSEFMELVMERGGATLNAHSTLTTAQMRELLFQLCFALHVAQKVRCNCPSVSLTC